MSLRGLAGRVQLSPAYVSLVERDQTIPTRETIQRMAQVLDGDERGWLSLRGQIPSEIEGMILRDSRWWEVLWRIHDDGVSPAEVARWLDARGDDD